MNVQKVSFLEVSYTNNDDIRILNAILSSWFSDPKIFHFTAPNHHYPFKISKWISLSYTDQDIRTFCLKLDNWIIGHISMKLNAVEKSAHLFHLIIDEKYRNKGYAKKLVNYVEQKLTDKEKFNRLSLNCVKKNQSALALYQSLGFSIVKKKKHISRLKSIVLMNRYF